MVRTGMWTPFDLELELNKASKAGLNVISVAIGGVTDETLSNQRKMSCVIVTENVYG